jgi:hypothetical protein
MREGDEQIEGLLRRYRPSGPGSHLRDHALAHGGRRLGRVGPWLAAAAWVLCSGLWIASMRLEAQTAALVLAPRPFTLEAHHTVNLVGGGPRAERYIQLAISTEPPVVGSASRRSRDINGDIQ